MGNYKFYTPPLLAECLVKHLPKQKYNNVIDICCGSWNLLKAAQKVYRNSNYTGVDVDIDAGNNRLKEARFICLDGREFATRERKKYDLILSNPPYGYLEENDRYYRDSSKTVLKELISKRYENEMMQANLILSKKNGVLLFILPSTFFEGDTFLSIRKSLCRNYTIESIVKLPLETFGSSRISSYALIIRNIGKQCKRVSLKEAVNENNKWRINHCKYIPISSMMKGYWIFKDLEKKNHDDIEIFRGNISTANMSNTGRKVFHNSSKIINGEWHPSVRYCDDDDKLRKAKKVRPGDIIVNRVGRYARYWYICKEEAYVSDCLIVIKRDKKTSVYDSLMDNTIEGQLNISKKGVATRYITIKDLRNIF